MGEPCKIDPIAESATGGGFRPDDRRAGRRRAWLAIIPLVALALLIPGLGTDGEAEAAKKGETLGVSENREHLSVALHQSRVITLRTATSRVSVANPDIVDIVVLDPRQVYVVGKQLGTTNLVLWDDKDKVRGMVRLEVTHDLDLLKSKLHELLPKERIQVRSAQGSIVVSGQVSSPGNAEAAVRLAEGFAQATGDKTAVLNMIQVGGTQQVMLEVKVAEIARTLTKRLDIQFSGLYDGGSIRIGKVGTGAVGGVSGIPSGGGLAFPDIAVLPSVIQDEGLFLSSLSGNFLFNLFIDAAKDQGLAKILAEPNLTTLSGQRARFLAGGEFPIPVAQELGVTTIEFKEYGVGVQFLPVVLDSGMISMTLDVSVSEPTTEGSIVVDRFNISALKKRSANSTVEVRSGETIALAGLINETLRENVEKFPGLGELPILGMLFRSQEFIKGQSELVIFVTPRLARAFDPSLVKLPTDSFVEPSDQEFYLMGRLKARPPGERAGTTTTEAGLGPDKSGSEGHFGHDL